MAIGHIGLNVPDQPEAKNYYNEVLPLVGYEPFFDNETEFSYMPASAKRGAYVFFYQAEQDGQYSRQRSGLQHLAFMVPTRSAVHNVNTAVVRLGGEVLHPPQEFPQYPPPYFATFWLDPFGIMLEAVCHHDRD